MKYKTLLLSTHLICPGKNANETQTNPFFYNLTYILKWLICSYNVQLDSTLSSEEITSWRVLSYTIQMYYVREYHMEILSRHGKTGNSP
jgi:hypothetical protein